MLSSDALPPGSIVAMQPIEFTTDERDAMLRAIGIVCIDGVRLGEAQLLMAAAEKIKRLTPGSATKPLVIGILNR